MQILVLLGMYFDAVVVFVTSQTLLFRLDLAILCLQGTLQITSLVQIKWVINFWGFSQHVIHRLAKSLKPQNLF